MGGDLLQVHFMVLGIQSVPIAGDTGHTCDLLVAISHFGLMLCQNLRIGEYLYSINRAAATSHGIAPQRIVTLV